MGAVAIQRIPPEIRPCTWCGTEVEAPAVDLLPGQEPPPVFCCSGCEAAWCMVEEAGLHRYFERRALPAPRPGAQQQAAWDRIPRVDAVDGGVEAVLHIDGLRCAACTWVTERVLADSPGVLEATVSYGTGVARVRWDPSAGDLGDALQRISRLGYRPRPLDATATDDDALLRRLGAAAFCTMNIMLIAAAVYLGWITGMDERYATLFRWATLALATPVALYSAAPFFAGAWAGLRVRVLHMDLPIAIAVAGIYGHGLWATLAGRDGWLDSMAMLVTLLLAGRVLEQRGRRQAAEAAQALAAEAPAVARRITPEGLETVDASALRPGDRLELAAGEGIAADGVVTSGFGRVQQSLLTGESEPTPVWVGSGVVAGGLLVDGSLRMEVRAATGETMLDRMAAALTDAASRPSAPTTADRLAPWFVALTLLVAAATFLAWWSLAGVAAGAEAAVAVLVVACPCALALAAPLAAHAGLGAAARRGLLLRSGDAVRRAAQVDLVAFDKTGTVTWGQPRVVEATDRSLRIAAGIERGSLHPIARAIVDEARARGIAIPLGSDLIEEPGVGMRGRVDGRTWVLRSGGPGIVRVEALDGRHPARLEDIVLHDRIRPGVRQAFDQLRRDLPGLELALVTGDADAVAERIGAEAGIQTIRAAMTPEQKALWVKTRQAEGRRVMFVGDGLNDGPALAAAHVGVAMGSGVASTVLVADGVVLGGELASLRAGLVAARLAARLTRRNVIRSVAYNVAAVGLAAAGLVNPLVAAVLMPLSSGLVLAGALSVEGRVARTLGKA